MLKRYTTSFGASKYHKRGKSTWKKQAKRQSFENGLIRSRLINGCLMIFDDFCQVWIVRLALLPLAKSMLWVMLANLGCSICMRLRLQRRILNHPGAGTHQIDPALNQRFLGRVVYLIY
jgi:hypothetical protein